MAVPSLFVEHPQALLSVESCDPFGCKTETRVDAAALAALALEAPLGRCNGFGTSLNAAHLAWGDLEAIRATAPDAGTAHAS